VQRIPAVPKHQRDTIFNEYFPETNPVDPNAQPAKLLWQQAQDASWHAGGANIVIVSQKGCAWVFQTRIWQAVAKVSAPDGVQAF